MHDPFELDEESIQIGIDTASLNPDEDLMNVMLQMVEDRVREGSLTPLGKQYAKPDKWDELVERMKNGVK